MQPIHTNEAKSLISESYPVIYGTLVRGTLRKFLHDGSSTVFACKSIRQRKTASTLFTSGVDSAVRKIQVLIDRYAGLPVEGLFDDYEPVPAHPEGMIYWDDLLRAVTLVALFDHLVALTYKYPSHLDESPAKIRKAALIVTMRPLCRVKRASRIVNSGRAFEQG
ncbi:hypothetical protein H8F21_14620 [Pseudomonas sp. P66]|uniref:Uncharacterized protein n=1 Tax=Pseudomonas arcuscaelestis TaxID=2710591 RepID=A0ABS2BYX3_9PSED|nr:hypothetical protein [Pseudomonas arcuscaelestis]MBM5458799.1 hypothetical protein [Pseudomonas arcuscaelestis]